MKAAFVGREPELEALVNCASGGVAVISGEPGIGKSYLAEEHARRRSGVAAWGWASDGPWTPAFGPWIQILRQLAQNRELGSHFAAPEIQALLDSTAAAHDRVRVFEVIHNSLRAAAAERPLMLGFDDLDGADVSTLLLLQRVIRHPGALLVVATVRATPPQIAKLPAVKIALGRLGREELARWIALVAPQLESKLDQIFQSSRGNPLFVTALLAAAQKRPSGWTMPHDVGEAVRQHLSLLSAPAAGLLQTASVLGREFPLRDLNALVPAPSVLIDEAVHLGVLMHTDDERLRFAHVLLRDELYGWLPAERRRGLHLAAAGMAETSEAIAHHQLLGAGPDALSAVRAAMKDANRRLAFEDAAELGERALHALTLSPADRGVLTSEIGDALSLASSAR